MEHQCVRFTSSTMPATAVATRSSLLLLAPLTGSQRCNRPMWRSPDAYYLIGHVLISSSLANEDISMPDDPLQFKVVRTNGHDEVLARAANLIIGRAAYETARQLYPDDRVDYRDGARIIARSDQSPLIPRASGCSAIKE
jgi:hypothetical protein